MSENWSFESLDLSKAEVDSGEQRLKVGRYVCKITEAKIEPTSTDKRGRRLQLRFVDTDGHGSIGESINIYLPNSPKAVEIGEKQLKTLLTHGGHPNPDSPKDVASMIGLTVGVNVSKDTFTNDNGEEIDSSAVNGWHPYFDPKNTVGLGPKLEVMPAVAAKANGKGEVTDEDGFDDIPF